jgi:predicted ester cyclase
VQALVAFRASMNGAIDYSQTLIEEMLIDPEMNVTEVKVHAEGRHAGMLAGIPATGRPIVYDVQTLNQFKGDRMALRWDRTPNLLAAIRDLAAPSNENG